MNGFPADPFWDFSLSLYSRREVQEACLRLQNRLGLDVNLVLFALWVGASGRGGLAAAEMADLVAALAPWRERVVLPLRRVRDTLKAEPHLAPELIPELRRKVLAVELDAEHIQQLALSARVRARPADEGKALAVRARDAAANWRAYLAAARVEAAAAAADLAIILEAAIPALGAGGARAALAHDLATPPSWKG